MVGRVAVIVPVLDEVRSIGATVRSVLSSGAYCIVVDGGSTDGTLERAREQGALTLAARRGRAAQMNAGAREAGAFEILLFLHADVTLPDGWRTAVETAIDQGALWGRFDVVLDSTSWVLGVVGDAMNLRSRITGIATGDQAIFIRRASFDALGGFADLPLMEDVDLCTRLVRARLPRAALRDRVRVSARRWERHGVARTVLLMWCLRFLWWVGVPADRLHRMYYGQPR